MIRITVKPGTLAPSYNEGLLDGLRMVSDTMEEARNEGLLEGLSPEEVTEIFLSAVRSCAKRWILLTGGQ